jgi:hypothetical protein
MRQIRTIEWCERQKVRLRNRKARLKAEQRCIDCAEPKGERFVRCFKCRLEYRERAKKQAANKRCQPQRAIDPNHLRNAKLLRSELYYDDGLDKRLRGLLVQVIDQWKRQEAA